MLLIRVEDWWEIPWPNEFHPIDARTNEKRGGTLEWIDRPLWEVAGNTVCPLSTRDTNLRTRRCTPISLITLIVCRNEQVNDSLYGFAAEMVYRRRQLNLYERFRVANQKSHFGRQNKPWESLIASKFRHFHIKPSWNRSFPRFDELANSGFAIVLWAFICVTRTILLCSIIEKGVAIRRAIYLREMFTFFTALAQTRYVINIITSVSTEDHFVSSDEH